MKGGLKEIRREMEEMKRDRKRLEKWEKKKEWLIERIRKVEKRLMEGREGLEERKVNDRDQDWKIGIGEGKERREREG